MSDVNILIKEGMMRFHWTFYNLYFTGIIFF